MLVDQRQFTEYLDVIFVFDDEGSLCKLVDIIVTNDDGCGYGLSRRKRKVLSAAD